MMKRRIVGVAVAAFVACAPQIARADVITVTSGWLSWDSDLGSTHASMVLGSSPFSQFSFAVLETPLPGTVNAGGQLQPGQTVGRVKACGKTLAPGRGAKPGEIDDVRGAHELGGARQPSARFDRLVGIQQDHIDLPE